MREAAFAGKDQTEKLKNLFYVFIEPSLDQCGLFLGEHFLVKGDADVLENCERKKTLVRSEAAAILDQLLDALGPTRRGSVQSDVSQRHAEPFDDCLVVSKVLLGEKREQLVSQLQDVRVLEVEFEVCSV